MVIPLQQFRPLCMLCFLSQVTKIFQKKKNSVTYSFRQSFSLYGMQVLLFENQCEYNGAFSVNENLSINEKGKGKRWTVVMGFQTEFNNQWLLDAFWKFNGVLELVFHYPFPKRKNG